MPKCPVRKRFKPKKRVRRKQVDMLSVVEQVSTSNGHGTVSPECGTSEGLPGHPLSSISVDESCPSVTFVPPKISMVTSVKLPESCVTPSVIVKTEEFVNVDCSPTEDIDTNYIPKAEKTSAFVPRDPLAVGDINLLAEAKRKLDGILYQSWATLVRNNGLHVFLVSRKEELAVQRRLFFSADGDVKFSVHCIPFPVENFIDCSKVPPSTPLTRLTIDDFVKRCFAMVEVLRTYEICTGHSETRNKHVWPHIQGATIDCNPYQEGRYSETLRSDKCVRLVVLRKRRCGECDKLGNVIKRRVESFSKEIPHPTTPNIFLSEEQKLKKLEAQRKALNTEARRLERLLVKNIEKSVSGESED